MYIFSMVIVILLVCVFAIMKKEGYNAVTPNMMNFRRLDSTTDEVKCYGKRWG